MKLKVQISSQIFPQNCRTHPQIHQNSLQNTPQGNQQSHSIYYLVFGQSIKITLQILDKYRCIYRTTL